MILDIFLDSKKEVGLYSAKAQYDTCKNHVIILKDSKWSQKENGSVPESIQKLRKQIINDNKVNSQGLFIDDYKITTRIKRRTSLSPAAGVITNSANAGPTIWKININGKETPLYEYLSQIGVLDSNGKYIPQESNTFQIAAENNEQTICEALKQTLSQNIIFYGVPGCGKSHKINELLSWEENNETVKMPSQYYKRILFHPEYSYSDFVGQTMPQTGDNGSIEYVFTPGPFVEILCEAYQNKDYHYFLIIEEINRGNAPAIFGDLFQLLDRDEKGASEYGIYNKDILNELKKISNDIDEVKIPANLTIFATMNTCDQNVFTMDTAFKRRWRMKRINNDFDDPSFKESDLAKATVIDSNDITWKDFGKAVNSAIVNNCNDGSSSEDKQLGTYFVKAGEIEDKEAFAEKVIMYLWDDVAKYDKSQLFDTNKYKTLDMAINGFANGENVFSPRCKELTDLYNDNSK